MGSTSKLRKDRELAEDLSRRSFLIGSALALRAADTFGRNLSAPPISAEQVRGLLKFNDLDEAIWRDELEEFVPARIRDMHSHLTRYDFDLRPQKAKDFHWTLPSAVFRREGSLELLDACEAVLYPGRTVSRLMTPTPHPKCDFAGSNEFIAREARKKPGTYALMLVHPRMTAEEVERSVARHHYLGFKPYRFFSVTGDIDECRITDFMPEHQIAVANRYGLMILLHLSKKLAIADAQNLNDLERLANKYTRVRWQLAHCARSYSDWALNRAAATLRRIPNLWYDTSSVSDSDAFYALFTGVDLDRVCYGSDDFAVGVTRGKYVTYGFSWGEMDELNQTLNKTHCDGRFTFVRYEMLRGMRRAARYAGLSRLQVENIFYNNGQRLIERVGQA